MQTFGFFHSQAAIFRKAAFLCLALQFFNISSAVATPLVERATLAAQKRQAELSSVQQYVLVVPAGHETLASIAARFDVTEASLQALHNQAVQAGWTGQAIMVPLQSSGESRLYPTYMTYTLAMGETLGSLALRFNRSEPELRRLNAMVLGEAALNNLKAGDVLLVPAVLQKHKAAKGIHTGKNQQDFETLLAKVASDAGNAYEKQARNTRGDPGNFLAQHGASTATNAVTNLVSSSFEDALAPYGRAKVGLRANARTNDVDISVDYLHSLSQTDDDILFAQVGARTFDNRNLSNVGVGYRRLINPDLMLGANTFFDHDFTRGHTRAGMGVEVWGNSARMASNVYAPVSSWKKSDQQRLNSDLNRMNLLERPAAGWDVRGEVLIPGAPQFSATAQYFQWKGKGVDAFGGSKLRKDPVGHSVGLKWQPMPLIGFTSEHQSLQGGTGRFKFGVDLNWSFDRDLKKQQRTEQASALRPLVLAKQDFVDRNYNVVLNYKEQAKYKEFSFISHNVIVQANPRSGTSVTQLPPMLRGVPAAGIVRYELVNNSSLVTIDPLTGVITLAPGAETQQVTAIARLYMPRIASLNGEGEAVEKIVAFAGNVLRAATDFFIPAAYAADLSGIPQNYLEVADANYLLSVLEGQALPADSIELHVITTGSPADGSTKNVVNALVIDKDGIPVSDAEVRFTLSSSAIRDVQTAATGQDGSARFELSSSVAGPIAVTGEVNGKSHTVDVHFISDVQTAKIALTANKTTAVAGGEIVTLSGMLTDGNNNKVSDVLVGFMATNNAQIVRSAITDKVGSFTVELWSDVAGKTDVTASIDGDKNAVATVSIQFVANSATAKIISLAPVAASGDVLANDKAEHSAIATVTDVQGNLLKGAVLDFDKAPTTTVNASPTGEDGTTLVTFTSTKAGPVTVKAKINGSEQSVTQDFMADVSTAVITSSNLMVSTDGAVANGSATNAVTATVTDAHGN
ncbi:inverse autotransporter beta domain-containing protein, partial [Pseudomonas chlororaphis]|uniref:inverse autotransporter beta domain-containing protein n=1 Tax=Pseudomonas chlororaphis TaxID=587753 RepID=UPI0039E6BD87